MTLGQNTWAKHLGKTLGQNTWAKNLGKKLGKNKYIKHSHIYLRRNLEKF